MNKKILVVTPVWRTVEYSSQRKEVEVRKREIASECRGSSGGRRRPSNDGRDQGTPGTETSVTTCMNRRDTVVGCDG